MAVSHEHQILVQLRRGSEALKSPALEADFQEGRHGKLPILR